MKNSLLATLALPLLALVAPSAGNAQETPEIRGEAILAHPAGKLALKTDELLFAGKIDEAIALRSTAEQADWKKSPAGERKDMGERMKQRAPEPKAFAAAIRKAGVLQVTSNGANLQVPMAGGTAVAFFELEGGMLKASSGPMLIPGEEERGNETRINGAEILKHPIGALALSYAEALHGKGMGEVMKLASAKAQANWKAQPKGEQAESTAYRKRTVPTRSELAGGIEKGGMLIIEGNLATLNVVTFEQKSSEPGVVSSSSTTTAIPFVLEGGTWKLAQ
ncbi:MAG: hypothetical protein ABIT01_13115 [Thermoanaerobaculia bacterium]